MAGCVLFVRGKDFDVDAFLKSSQWRKTASLFHKGDKSESKRIPDQTQSGFRIDISDSDDRTGVQLQKATAFFKSHDSELQRLREFPGLEEIELRFGHFLYEDSAAFIFSLSPELVSMAGRYNVEITSCVYKTHKRDDS